MLNEQDINHELIATPQSGFIKHYFGKTEFEATMRFIKDFTKPKGYDWKFEKIVY